MADNEIKPSTDGGREELVAKQLASTKIHLALTQERVDVSGAIKLPLERIPQLGVAFASLPSMFRTVTNTVSVPTLLQATDKFGNPLDPSKLNSFKDGSGLTGGYRDAVKGFGQARFHVVEGDIATSVTQVPYDPTSLFMAAAIAQINQKLDSIQESVDEMFEYMRQRDKANMRGNLKTLADILNGYGLNYGNATYMANAHMKVLDIKQSSAQDMELFRSQAQADLKKKGFIEVRDGLGRRLDKVLDYLKDCQLATYIHAFSLFLEPMLAQNFEPAKLADATAKIEADSIAYRELYTECTTPSRRELPTPSMRHCWAASRPRANCSVTPSQRPPWANIRSSTRHSRVQERTSAGSTTGNPRNSSKSSIGQRRLTSHRSSRA